MTTTDLSLVVVEVETKLGARYVFPDMPWDVLSELCRNNAILGFSQLSLVNQSGAAFIIPTRIIKSIKANGEVTWVCPV